jgi:hypothetical protein
MVEIIDQQKASDRDQIMRASCGAVPIFRLSVRGHLGPPQFLQS